MKVNDKRYSETKIKIADLKLGETFVYGKYPDNYGPH